MHSVYKYMKNRNRCNHRDYQNLGVNGARSGAVANGLVNDLARGKDDSNTLFSPTPFYFFIHQLKKKDPVLLFLELIGNDVCNGHHTFDTM